MHYLGIQKKLGEKKLQGFENIVLDYSEQVVSSRVRDRNVPRAKISQSPERIRRSSDYVSYEPPPKPESPKRGSWLDRNFFSKFQIL